MQFASLCNDDDGDDDANCVFWRCARPSVSGI